MRLGCLEWRESESTAIWPCGFLATMPLVTSTLFDIGVYLVVFGLVLDVLRSLGAEIDRQEEDDLETALDETATSRGGAS